METTDADEIKRLTEELTTTSHKLAEKMYSQASQQGAGPGGPGAGSGSRAGPAGGRNPTTMWWMRTLKK